MDNPIPKIDSEDELSKLAQEVDVLLNRLIRFVEHGVPRSAEILVGNALKLCEKLEELARDTSKDNGKVRELQSEQLVWPIILNAMEKAYTPVMLEETNLYRENTGSKLGIKLSGRVCLSTPSARFARYLFIEIMDIRRRVVTAPAELHKMCDKLDTFSKDSLPAWVDAGCEIFRTTRGMYWADDFITPIGKPAGDDDLLLRKDLENWALAKGRKCSYGWRLGYVKAKITEGFRSLAD